jgi:hypothetical protein
MKIFKITLLVLLSFSLNIFSQSESIKKKQSKINQLFNQIIKERNDDISVSCNDTIFGLMEEILKSDSSFYFDYQEIEHIGKITSQNKRINIFTWNIPLRTGMLFRGFIQCSNGNIFPLKQENTFKPSETEQYNYENWYGALYYEIVDFQIDDITYYALLGWSVPNTKNHIKLIDILSIKDNIPMFGLNIFDDEKREEDFYTMANGMLKSRSRAIFEYDANSTMLLVYNSKNKQFEFEHLSPMQVINEQIVSYGADLSTDIYKLKKGKWVYKSNVRIKKMGSKLLQER